MAGSTYPLNAPLCSVCIANYNGLGLIEACIDSVLAQGWNERVEIIVHDDASTDGSAELIRQRYPTVKLLVGKENVGFCLANNRMARQASGQYLLLLNNDAELMAGALDTLLDAAEKSPQGAILGLPQYDAQSGELLDIGSLLDPFLNPVPNLDAARNDVGMVMGACLWLPKSLWDELGGFPEWFGSIGEDLYLCSAARLQGYAVRAIGASGYRHHVGKSFGGGKVTREQRLSTTSRRRALSERNKTLVMLICYPSLWLLIFLPLHILLLVMEGLLLSLLKWDIAIWQSIYWKSLISLSKNFARAMQERQRINALHRITLRKWSRPFTWLPHKLRLLIRHGTPHIQH